MEALGQPFNFVQSNAYSAWLRIAKTVFVLLSLLDSLILMV